MYALVEVPTSTTTYQKLMVRDDVIELDTTDDKRNSDNIVLLYASWLCLLADSPLHQGNGLKPRRLFNVFYTELTSGPLVTVILKYSALADRLANSVKATASSDSQVEWVEGFKDTPVFKEYLAFYRTQNPVLFRFLYSFCQFGKKLDFEDPELHATALRAWQGVEERLSSLKLRDDYLEGLRRIVEELLHDFDIYPFWPKHGPGAVVERGVRGTRDKCTAVTYDATIDELFYTGETAQAAIRDGKAHPKCDMVPDDTMWDADAGLSSPDYALQMMVAKNASTARSIAMESATRMYHQQGLMASMIRTMEKTVASDFINIKDQARNVGLARYGSLTGRIDTIDLKSASDSVHVDLVRAIFPDSVLPYLLGTRSSKVKTHSGETVNVHKFAPMGSAVCFPVQCLVFTAVVIYSAMCAASSIAAGNSLDMDSPMWVDLSGTIRRLFRRTVGPRIRSRRDDDLYGALGVQVRWDSEHLHPDNTDASIYLVRSYYEPAAIYGDDICVDSSLTQYVIHLLTALGFEVNISKSFIGDSAFRESCGGYFYKGHDVTPVRYQVARSTDQLSADTVASLTSMVNRSRDYGYKHLRRCLLRALLKSPWKGVAIRNTAPVLFTDDRRFVGSAILTEHPNNQHLRKRFGDYHRYEVRHAFVEPCETEAALRRKHKDEDPEHPIERYLYMRWCSNAVGRGSTFEDDVARHPWDEQLMNLLEPKEGSSAPRWSTSGTRLGWRWTPVG